MRTLTAVPVLKQFDITGDEEEMALRTFSAEQIALFHNMYTETLLMRATLAYDPENPLSQCTAAFEFDGKIKLLKLLLAFSEPGSTGLNSSEQGSNSPE
jgi:hypothetical protein